MLWVLGLGPWGSGAVGWALGYGHLVWFPQDELLLEVVLGHVALTAAVLLALG